MSLADQHDDQPAAGVVEVRPLRAADLSRAASLHAECLPHGFFGQLGTPFLRAYYASFLTSPHAVALAAAPVGGGAADGVLVGTLDVSAHYRHVLRANGPRLAVAGVLALLTRPRLLVLFLRTRLLRYLRAAVRFLHRSTTGRTAAPAAPAGPPGPGPAAATGPDRVAVLTHVSVDAGARGRGTGATLVKAFEAAARADGCAEAQLVTLEAGAAGRLYRRLGWTARPPRQDHDGRTIRTYVRSL